MPNLASELRRLREARGLTPQAIESRTRGKVSAATVAVLEARTARQPDVDTLRQLARVLHIAPWHLLKAAGYVTDQDALDGIEAMKGRGRRRAA